LRGSPGQADKKSALFHGGLQFRRDDRRLDDGDEILCVDLQNTFMRSSESTMPPRIGTQPPT
jgi:hypothetical protein